MLVFRGRLCVIMSNICARVRGTVCPLERTKDEQINCYNLVEDRDMCTVYFTYYGLYYQLRATKRYKGNSIVSL